MKSGNVKKITAHTPLPPTLRSPSESTPAGFFRVAAKASGLTHKEVATAGRVNDTTCEGWFNGSRPDPFSRARDLFAAFTRNNKGLGPNILAYIGGGDDFDGRVLTAEQWELFKQLFKEVKPCGD